MTTNRIDRAAVIGAGTMGAALAAHLANAGIQTALLDIVPSELTPQEKEAGLSLADRAVRNRVVNDGWGRCLKARPANLFAAQVADRVTLGNLEDDFSFVAEADWVIEAIVERLDIKQKLMARIDEVRGPETIVSTNTSGILVHQIAEGRSDSFQQHFLGTHFFNPPRYLKLLEIIPHAKNSPELVGFMREFCTRVLGKGVVICKDTPNFIANRILSIAASYGMNYALDEGYTVEEVDAITGPAVGRPKTATFRLNDLIGIDVMAHVSQNLYDAIPHDPQREVLRHPPVVGLMQNLIQRGWLGNKTDQGFYKRVSAEGKKEFWSLNLKSMEYQPPEKVRFDSIGAGRKISDVRERLGMLAYADDRAGQYVWRLLSRMVHYAAACVPEISDDILSIDNACKWGFMWDLGPFETWDALGVARSAERMKAEGLRPPAWVDEMLAAGFQTFYETRNGRVVGYYDPQARRYQPLPKDPNAISVEDLRAEGRELERNDSASLLDMGNGVLLLEFHNPAAANALDEDIFNMLEKALDELDNSQWQAMVIGNEGKHFCAGANIFMMAVAAQQGDEGLLKAATEKMQGLLQRMRYAPKPIVAAPFGMVLGGGCELVMAASRVVAAAESYIGLVEMGVGLIPAGTGTKEMIRRLLGPVMAVPNADPLPHLQKAFEQIALAKVAESALQAKSMGFLGMADRIIMNQDHLLAEAKRTALEMAAQGYRSMAPQKVWACGRDMLATLKVAVWSLLVGAYATPHDAVVANKLARVLTGGDLTEPGWVPEQVVLELEKEAILDLFREPKTQERMWYMLEHKKPLRN